MKKSDSQRIIEVKIELILLSLTRISVWNLWLDQRTANVRHNGLTWNSMNIITSIKLWSSKMNIISYGWSSKHIRGQYQVMNNIFDMILQVESIWEDIRTSTSVDQFQPVFLWYIAPKSSLRVPHCILLFMFDMPKMLKVKIEPK